MKSSIKKLLVLLVVVASFVATQAVWAGRDIQGDLTFLDITGEIIGVDASSSTIDVEEEDGDQWTISCIPFNYLLSHYGIDLAEDDAVSVRVYERTFSETTVRYIAVTLTVEDGELILLRDEETLKPIRNP